jgi:hypothetical protein
MKRTIVAIVAVAFFAPAGAADAPQPSSTTPAPTGSSKLNAKPGAKAAPPQKVSPAVQKLRDVDTTKAAFMAALGSCPRPEACDPKSPDKNMELVKMLQGREDAFMEACAQCASDKACDEERDKIRSGRGRFGYNVCAPPKGTTPPAADKKAPATKPAADPKTPTSK